MVTFIGLVLRIRGIYGPRIGAEVKTQRMRTHYDGGRTKEERETQRMRTHYGGGRTKEERKTQRMHSGAAWCRLPTLQK